MFCIKNNTYYIAATRFNDITWQENENFRIKHKMKGCIYGVSKEIPLSIKHKSIVFVFEMNNSKPNMIMGMGIIKNYLKLNKHHKIYKDNNYNRFSYNSKYRLTREILRTKYKDVLLTIEDIVFRGKDHIKRGQGITRLPLKKTLKYQDLLNDFVKEVIKTLEI
jgi:hypothetical protein